MKTKRMIGSFCMMAILLTGCASSTEQQQSTAPAEMTATTITTESDIGTMLENKDSYKIYEKGFVRDGKHIYGNLYLPTADSDKKYPTVIISHGYEGSYTEMAPYAQYLAEHNIAAYVFDFCGGSYSSNSDGATTDMSVLTEEADLTTVLDGISAISQIDTNQIFLMGESQGGMVSALTAADQSSRIKSLVLLYPAFVIPDNARALYPNAEDVPETMDLMGMEVGKIYYTDVHDMDVYSKISEYTGKVLILHGDQDNLVPLSSSQKAVQSYTNAELTVIKGGSHGFYGDLQQKAAEDAEQFISGQIQ